MEGLRLIPGGAAPVEAVAADPVVFQRECVDAFVASWHARGFSPVTIDNDIGLLERTLTALGCPAWEVTSEDIDRVVGELAMAGGGVDAAGVRADLQGFHRFLQTRKAAEIEAAFGRGWCARWMSSTRPGTWATTRRQSRRRRPRSG